MGEPVVVVGMGDDGPAGLGERARESIRRAELLAGGRRHLAFFPQHPADKLPITSNLEEVVGRLRAESAQRRCVVLASGDPCLFGIGPMLAERLGRERVQIIPQASAVSLAFARLGLAWEDATVLSAHGRPLADLLEQALSASKLAILTDDQNTPGAIAAALMAAGMPDCPAVVLEHLGGANERVFETSLGKLPGETFESLNVLVLLPGSHAAGGPTFGRSETEFRHPRGQITKAEARAVALAKLRLPLNGVLWDVGAGAGSLSIEAAGLMPRGTVYAVEPDVERLACLRENIDRHSAPRVRPVAGHAPQALGELPKPQRVFVGGGGRALPAIIQACLERLDGEGRLVANAATLESALEVASCFRMAGWEGDLVQVSVARGRAIAGRTRLEAQNPVFILSAWPAGGRGDGTRRRGDALTRGRGDAGTRELMKRRV
jgi:precorrin-6Y C5,15-methyltransferase (decarboxylating)